MTRPSDDTIYKAQPVSDETIPDLHIVATATMPESKTLPDAQTVYGEQARAIADALHASLPGDTLHALLVELLDRKACLLRVPA